MHAVYLKMYNMKVANLYTLPRPPTCFDLQAVKLLI